MGQRKHVRHRLISVVVFISSLSYACAPVRYSHGQPCVESVDREADGSTDLRIVYTYDELGRCTSEQTIDEMTGTNLSTTYLFYDSSGDLIERVGGINRYVYYYDDAGRRIGEEWHDNSGNVDVFIHTYDEQGNLVSTLLDHPILGFEIRYSYDEEGNLVREEVTSLHTGAQTRQSSFFYDDNGNRTLEEHDGNGHSPPDGVVDRRVTFSFNDEGNLVSEDVELSTSGGWRRFYGYDEHGRLMSLEEDSGADGIIDTRRTYTFSCWEGTTQ